MPSHRCLHPTCPAILPARGYCPRHDDRAPKADTNERYDRERRDQEAKRFYNSAAWQHARDAKLSATPWCELCKRKWATTVHHDKPLDRCTAAEKTDRRNLVSTCAACHTALEVRRRAGRIATR